VEYGNCQQLIPALVGGYPTPNISWYYNGAKVTDDHQGVLSVMSNTSVSLGYMHCMMKGIKTLGYELLG